MRIEVGWNIENYVIAETEWSITYDPNRPMPYKIDVELDEPIESIRARLHEKEDELY